MMNDEGKQAVAESSRDGSFEGLDVLRVRPNVLADKTRAFALRIINFHQSLPNDSTRRVLGGQVLRSGTSVGAQYREACRARSRAEFVSKLESALQEADETQYWLELLRDSRLAPAETIDELHGTCEKLIRLMVSSVKTVKPRSGAGQR